MKIFPILKDITRNLFMGPVTRKYPYEVRPPFPGERGRLVIDESTCIYCGICAKKCPSNAIAVARKPNQEWKFERFRCILCGSCIEHCPKKCLSFQSRIENGKGK